MPTLKLSGNNFQALSVRTEHRMQDSYRTKPWSGHMPGDYTTFQQPWQMGAGGFPNLLMLWYNDLKCGPAGMTDRALSVVLVGISQERVSLCLVL